MIEHISSDAVAAPEPRIPTRIELVTAAARAKLPGTAQLDHALRAIILKGTLVVEAVKGTPARLHRNVTKHTGPDGEEFGVTRGERKREARVQVALKWTGEARRHHHWPLAARRRLAQSQLTEYREAFPVIAAAWDEDVKLHDDLATKVEIDRLFEEPVPVYTFEPVTTYAPDDEVVCGPYSSVRCVGEAKLLEDLDPLYVDQLEDGWYVVDPSKTRDVVAGPYKDKKTANRRLRQLGG